MEADTTKYRFKSAPNLVAAAYAAYGEGSLEVEYISLVEELKVPYQCIAAMLTSIGINGVTAAKITNHLKGRKSTDNLFLDQTLKVLKEAKERRVLPTTDLGNTTDILCLLVEFAILRKKLSNLQPT